ncbi:hypothetical protein GCM10009609_60440 [Pseudonocardia aurantiaca]|uniref:Nucleotidyltransferase domain-containing protein n=1 Tax=Pseudonocardia aurantiaca TaxID=75290 RepID=A0ABW4FEF9_9PSEU
MGADLGRWVPLPLNEVAGLFSSFPGTWWIAGGFAVELAVGHPVRDEHGDIDVGVVRSDHLTLHDVLRGWELWAADPPGSLRRWSPGEQLPAHVHDVWCKQGPEAPWGLQVMIDDTDGDEWVSRRDSAVRRPLAEIIGVGSSGVPYLIPAVQMYYKAARHRPKDDVDLRAVLPVMTGEERRWLRATVEATFPGHPWLSVVHG